ncbi:MAG: McrB family protein [Candidatus Coproplasma sp.]
MITLDDIKNMSVDQRAGLFKVYYQSIKTKTEWNSTHIYYYNDTVATDNNKMGAAVKNATLKHPLNNEPFDAITDYSTIGEINCHNIIKQITAINQDKGDLEILQCKSVNVYGTYYYCNFLGEIKFGKILQWLKSDDVKFEVDDLNYYGICMGQSNRYIKIEFTLGCVDNPDRYVDVKSYAINHQKKELDEGVIRITRSLVGSDSYVKLLYNGRDVFPNPIAIDTLLNSSDKYPDKELYSFYTKLIESMAEHSGKIISKGSIQSAGVDQNSTTNSNTGSINMIKISDDVRNIILYGPPGTGKTYSTAIYAVSICDGPDNLPPDYDSIMRRYQELREEGRIWFTTFHQSYGYEEFIEGISPILNEDSAEVAYTIKDGVFKAFCDKSSRKAPIVSGSVIRENPAVWCVILGGSQCPNLKQECYDEGTIRIGWSKLPAIITESTEDINDKERRILLNFQDEMEVGDIVVVRSSKIGVDGVGVIVGEAEFDSKNAQFPRKRKVNWFQKGEEIKINDLNGGTYLDRKTIYPLTRINAGDLLARISISENVGIKTETRPHVFIIDEINRGNISKIFGELITLIEETKRSGSNESVPVVLPYSQKPFSVPKNVYILGTMNTADRSIALIDTALRRRFSFVEMMPDSSVLTQLNSGGSEIDIDGTKLDIVKLLNTINKRITLLYDREHTIGHAFFMPLIKTPTIETLKDIFEKKIIPLLQEYFYDDYSKIQLVLADNAKSSDDFKFICETKVSIKDAFKGNADEILNIDNEIVEYSIQKEAFGKIQSYIEIYSDGVNT